MPDPASETSCSDPRRYGSGVPRHDSLLDDDPVVTHAAETVAAASGRTLMLFDPPERWGPLGPTVSEVAVWQPGIDGGAPDGSVPFDSIVSVGQLGVAPDLEGLLARLDAVSTQATFLLFCEPTDLDGDVNDVTTTLWASGWTATDTRRFRARKGLRRHEYVWGRARFSSRRWE